MFARTIVVDIARYFVGAQHFVQRRLVVARPMGAVKERVIGDKSAFLTDGESDFADHALRMLSDDDEFKSASIVARRHGRSRSWDTTASEFETIFR